MSASVRSPRGGSAGTHGLVLALGWFSVGLGLAELLAPGQLGRFLGLGRSVPLRAYGARELAAGLGLLSQPDPRPFVWTRVVGDALDLATLVEALDRRNPRRGEAAAALAAVVGVTLLDLACAQRLDAEHRQAPRLRAYARRRGLPRPPNEMRGAARDFEVPRDMRIQEPLRPYAA